MKIAIGYPPLASKKGAPLLSQNRQFQWFSAPTYIYPVIPASAATLLSHHGHQVAWLDGIAENWDYAHWENELNAFLPELLFLETKTPVVKAHWQLIKTLKKHFPKLLIVLAGDHVSALPEESLTNSPVDYILTGGHYDFALLDLVNHLAGKTKLGPGFWYRTKNGKPISTGPTHQVHNLNSLPPIDRSLTRWELYARKNGNFKYLPGTYTMAGRDCWWRKDGGCTFCSWTTIFPQFSVRTPSSLLDEIGSLIELGVKEVFDDTGTFMAGPWLKEFCEGMIKRGYNKKLTLGCNLRFGVLKKSDYELLARANFRFLLYGLESASQSSVNHLNKGTTIAKIPAELKIISEVNKKEHGHLEPHVTCMLGYPWESLEEAQETIRFTKDLFSKGHINSLQATICIPYPGTQLFKDCEKNGLLTTLDWNKYDMRRPIMKSPIPTATLHALTQSVYTSFLSPRYLLRKTLKSFSSPSEFLFNLRTLPRLLGHLLDFRSH